MARRNGCVALSIYGALVIQVIQNVSVLGMMAFLVGRLPAIYSALTHSQHDLSNKILLGLVFGLFSASGNWLSVATSYGLMINIPLISAEVGGLLGGPLVGALAGAIGVVPRLFLGGKTLWPAVVANIVAGLVGGLILDRLASAKSDLRLAALTGFMGQGILTVLVLLTVRPLAQAWQLAKAAVVPAFAANTLAVWFFVFIVHDLFKKSAKLQASSVQQDLAQKKLDEQQLLLVQTEYRMLRAQINPHFFFNTLSTIQALITSEPEKSAILIKNMANFFRKTLNREQELVTVREELETVRDYVHIEKVRFGERINLVEALPAEVLEYEIPVFSLQILVENAIRHGLSLKKGSGTVWISGWRDGESWYLNVEDDGVGMSETRLEELRQGEAVDSARGTGIGLFNIQRRIRRLYGNAFDLKIQSQAHKGTSVTIKFPQGRGGRQP